MDASPSRGRNTAATAIGGKNKTACSASENAIACSRSIPQKPSIVSAANSKVPKDIGKPGTVLLKKVMPSVITIIEGALISMPVATATSQPAPPIIAACNTDMANAASVRRFSRRSSAIADANCGAICVCDSMGMWRSSDPALNSSARHITPSNTPSASRGQNGRS